MKRTALFLFLWAAMSPLLCAQYFGKMSVWQRDSALVAIAEEVIMQHAEKYIGHYGSPSIKYEAILKKTSYKKDDWGRGFYSVVFPYIDVKKRPNLFFVYDFAVQVDIWADTGVPLGLTTGSSFAYTFYNRPIASPREPRWEEGYIYYASDLETSAKKYQKFGDENRCRFMIYNEPFLYDKKKGHTRDTLHISLLDDISFLGNDSMKEHHGNWYKGVYLFRKLYVIERYSQDSVIRTQVFWESYAE